MNEATGHDREQKIVELVDAVERLTAARGALDGQEMDSDGVTEQIVELDDELLRELGAGPTRRTKSSSSSRPKRTLKQRRPERGKTRETASRRAKAFRSVQ